MKAQSLNILRGTLTKYWDRETKMTSKMFSKQKNQNLCTSNLKNVRAPRKIYAHKQIVLFSYLMEKGRQEKDSWLADYFATSFPEQRLVKVATRQAKEDMLDWVYDQTVYKKKITKGPRCWHKGCRRLEDNSCACLFCYSFQIITSLHYYIDILSFTAQCFQTLI